ncbi:colanic acid biosynthesis glycosyltransferase WcaI [Sphingomonas sp. MA1305]|uniref:WcaI family glycosyltransferase n=1 Tax=Sphingomonas sp. MA1305 TaxID=2479204 RepID=UPI0018E06053|nr:WcaI family glycosyltransferase [Sphingomonas sp. MA1305]MBI0477195.1 colanic acid biosynthesis glycosyltransferase WcaI [Sphingomonas sp. MA1305]
MKILVVGIAYAPEIISTGLYNTGMCEGLAARGNAVSIITTVPYYPQWRVWQGWRGMRWRRERENDVDVTRVPVYVPAKPTGLRRIALYFSFLCSAFLPALARAWRDRPDVVIAIAPTLIAAPLALLCARISGAKALIHVQDFEVGAALGTGLLDKQGIIARLAGWFEQTIIRRFDLATSISPQMCRRLAWLRGSDADIYQLRNWSDTNAVMPLDRPSIFRDRWNIKTPHVVLYAGNLGNKQGIEILTHVAAVLAPRGDVTVVICGEGPARDGLARAATGIPNIRMEPLQDITQLSDLLGLATLHVIPQRPQVADMVLPSKLTNIFASGRPVIVTAESDTGLAHEIEGAGVVVPPEDPDALAGAIAALLDDPTKRTALGCEARQKAERDWGREMILDRFDDWLHVAVGVPNRLSGEIH